MICFIFLSPTVLSFSSFRGLVVWGWSLWTDRVFSLSPGLAQRTPNNNNNNNNINNKGKMEIAIKTVHNIYYF